MISLGMLGLFLGAVLLGVGYTLLMAWLGDAHASEVVAAAESP